ncbi:winged helix-turn-helix domain-containing protein [Methanolobus sp.]|uniref:helix-turn-helix transcriptional regulator n=1 Tax=Methanolobus sp. TaxID=1874737 RepID=UPI0025D1AC59|nr:winged helix-turn-helix domain-containing protein [Methanolobus sp.]
MKKALLDVLFASEKRKSVLLTLQNDSARAEAILKSLNTTRQALLPQIRILEDHHLISRHEDTYKLTTLGKLIVNKMAPLIDTLEVLEMDIDYWGTHNLDFIPASLLKKMNGLGKCDIINPAITDIHEFDNDFYERSKVSSSVFRVSTYFHPMYSTLYPILMEHNVEIYLIISQEVLDRLRDKPDPDFAKLLENDLFKLYVYPKKVNLLTFAYNDYYFFMHLFKDNGEIDQKYILCSKPSALEWGKELFEYYLKDSVPINEI